MIDRDSPLSLVRQLSDGLRARILDGRLTAGSKVPSTREAAANLSVARNVVLEAYEQLEAEGYLEGFAGSGTRVADIAGADRYPAKRSTHRPARQSARRPATASDRVPATRAISVDFATACGVPEPSAFPVAAWKRCVAMSASDVAVDGLAFPDARGHERLREELSALVYRSRGIACEPERIFVTRGTTHALSLVARYLRPRTAHAVIEDPMLNSFRRLLARFSFEVACVPVDDGGLKVDGMRENPMRINPRQADETPSAHSRSRGSLTVVTPSHQFPSGVILPVSRRLELLDFASSSNGWIFEDDYDGELRLRGVPVPPVLCLDPSRVFYAGTFNKTLYPALRLGYLIVPGREVDPFAAMIRAYAEWPETLASGALAAFVGEGAYERHLRALRKLYARRRVALAESVLRHFGDAYAVKGSEAGCHCRLSPIDPSRRIDRELALANGVAVAEIAHYFAARSANARARNPRDDEGTSIRDDLLLGYGNLDEATIDRGIATLADAIG